MIRNLTWTLCVLLAFSCTSKKVFTQTQEASINIEEKTVEPLPIMTFVQDTIHIGKLIEGESRKMSFEFTNTGDAVLDIELVTACKCTSLDWPPEPIPPGEQGVITVEFNSTGFKGEVLKTIDVIANTDPIIVEAFFTAEVEAKE